MSDAGARPPGFVLRERHSWIECQIPDYAGLAAEVRTSLTNGEREAFIEALDRINAEIDADVKGYQDRFAAIAKRIAKAESETDAAGESAAKTKAYTAAVRDQRTLLDEQAANATARRRERLALVAPYIRAWNVCDDDGNDVPVPRDDIDAAIRWSDDTISDFLIQSCITGYKSGKGLRTQSPASKPTPEPTSAPPSESETEPAT